ncbi:unnamed protein product [Ostreobium quekettii]|uniref:Protein kinase domain-containing protein n=1 Tax=Ostreobium quekettii TaxID=121088 RepID=A0A8S1JC68_9CHLO|nr:unnamed protein product [Ostreobium quekettii]|eukprot:evm.model.scf_6.7 EVM.evm.TU.scf_6.7   scf_6:271858-282606(+)
MRAPSKELPSAGAIPGSGTATRPTRAVRSGAGWYARQGARRPFGSWNSDRSTAGGMSCCAAGPEGAAGVARAREADADEWFFTETGQKGWVEAMEIDTLTPELPKLLVEMGIEYDPEKLAKTLERRKVVLYSRAAQVAASLGTFFAKLARDYATGRFEAHMKKRADELSSILGKLGPSFVKIGQALSARPDLLPKVYLDSLSQLQDQLPAFPREIAMALIQEDLGSPVEELFAELSERPVAAASLGQVYRGRLKTGEEVAVKVQRPSIGETIALDMVLLRRLMGVIDSNQIGSFKVSQPLVPFVDELASKLFAELDYVQEGHNCEKFQELYGGMDRVKTPTIHWDYSARRVLTMEWIDGIKMTDTAAMAAAGLNVLDFVDVGVECALRQLLEHGFFHADPHPGNLLAMRNGDLAYLDFGMMSTAPQDARYAIIAHIVHLVNRDYAAMCEDYYALKFMDRSVDTSPIAPALAAFFDNVLDKTVAQLNFKAIVDGLGEVLFEFPFQVPSYYALILRSLTVLEGLALQTDPEYKLLGRAYPYMARRLLTDPVPELRSSFEDLVLQDGQFRWNRLENLLRESSKSTDFDASQLWLLAEWMVSPTAEGLRDPLVTELSRIVDAMAATDARKRLAERLGSDESAAALLPEGPRERMSRERGEALVGAIARRMGRLSPKLQGSGPLGLPLPKDIQQAQEAVTNQVQNTAPRLYRLLTQPGAVDMVGKLASQVGRRFAARSIKFVLGSRELQSESGSS